MSDHTSNATPAATLGEFLNGNGSRAYDGTDARSFLFSAEEGVEYGDDLRGGAVEWIEGMLAEKSDGEVLREIDDIADNLEGVVTDLREFMKEYFKHSGAVMFATEAVETFVAEPNEANRLALVQASEALDGYHFITMSRELRGRLRPFVISRRLKSRIDFGSLHRIAKDDLKLEAEAQQEAA